MNVFYEPAIIGLREGEGGAISSARLSKATGEGGEIMTSRTVISWIVASATALASVLFIALVVTDAVEPYHWRTIKSGIQLEAAIEQAEAEQGAIRQLSPAGTLALDWKISCRTGTWYLSITPDSVGRVNNVHERYESNVSGSLRRVRNR
jgi:hypothetical protein